MSKFTRMAAAALGLAMVASATLTSVASAAPVPPTKVFFALNRVGWKNANKEGCPAKVRLLATVRANTAGHVRIQFERGNGWMSAPVWVPVVAQPGGKYVAKIENVIPGIATSQNFKARVIAFGAGVTKKSKWDKLKIKC